MGTLEEITALEERLRQAELGPDPGFFEEMLADDAILDGEHAKAMVVEHHRPGREQKFTRVVFSDQRIVEHDHAAVVTGTWTYTTPDRTFTLRSMRVWHESGGRWRIIAASTTGG